MTTRYIFNTDGIYVAFLQGKNLFAPNCAWIGFIPSGNLVYSSRGEFIGYLLDDDRIVINTNEFKRPSIFPPFAPFTPFKPFEPFKRMRMPSLPYPYKDVFI